MWGFDDKEGTYQALNRSIFMNYGTGTIALGQEILINGATGDAVDGVNSGGIGCVASKVTEELKVAVLLP